MSFPVDRPPLTEHQRDLASDPRYLRFADAIAARYSARFPRWADEIASAAYLGLVLAASQFDSGRGLEFSTYVGHKVNGAIRDALRMQRVKGYGRDKGFVGPDVLPFGDAPLDLACEAEPAWIAEESADAILGLTQQLSDQCRDAIRRLFLDASTPTQAALADSMGLSRQRVGQIVEAGLSKLRKQLEAANA